MWRAMRKLMSNFLCLALASVVSAFVVNVFAQTPHNRAPGMEQSLQLFLQDFDHDRTVRYSAAITDLNGDGTPEAIYLMSNGWCGSGGCTTLILVRGAGSWKILTRIAITRPPIRVLTDKANGWRSIGVWVQGGGIRTGYEAELRFDGTTYPSNPSIPPARRLGKAEGEVLVPSSVKGTPLYPASDTQR